MHILLLVRLDQFADPFPVNSYSSFCNRLYGIGNEVPLFFWFCELICRLHVMIGEKTVVQLGFILNLHKTRTLFLKKICLCYC